MSCKLKMLRAQTLILFCNLIGFIISPSEHADGTPLGHAHGEEHSHHPPPPPQSSQIYPPNHIAPVPGHVPDPNLNHVPTHSPPPGPIIDNSLLGILKRKTTYGEPIEKLQKSSTEFWKNLRDYAIQKAQEAAAEKDGHKRDHHHEDHWPKVEHSFKQMLQDMGSMGKHNMKQNFKHTDKAISDLRENPHDEHRQGEIQNSIVKDLHHHVSTLFPSPLPSLGRLYNLITGSDGVNKEHHGEHYGSKEGHSGDPHDPHHDPSKDHLGHSGPPVLTPEGHHVHPDHLIQEKHGDHEGIEYHHDKDGHSKDKHMDHLNSSNHQGAIPPESSVVKNLLENILYYIPIDKFITYLVTKQH